MYINNLIYLLATEAHNDITKNDKSYKIIEILSKYQRPIHNYKADRLNSQEILPTVEEVLHNLVSATQKDIKVLSYKQPEFANYQYFPIVDRLGLYICDLEFLENNKDLLKYNHIENYSSIQDDIKSTIQSGLKEIKHSYSVMEKSVSDYMMPKLEKFAAEKDCSTLSKNEIYSLAVFADSLDKTLARAEMHRKEKEYPQIYRYQVFDKDTLENFKDLVLNSYNLVKEDNKQQHTTTLQYMEQMR